MKTSKIDNAVDTLTDGEQKEVLGLKNDVFDEEVSLTKKRYICIGNAETGEVKRVIASDLPEYAKVDDRYKKQVWFPTSKSIWRRFKAENPKFIAGTSEEFTGIPFTKVVESKNVKPADFVYEPNFEKGKVKILVNVTANLGNAYSRSEKRVWDGKVSSRKGNRAITKARKALDQTVVVGKFREEKIKMADLRKKVAAPKIKLIKGAKPVMVGKYSRDLINKIENQIRYGDYKKPKEGAIVARVEKKIDGEPTVVEVTILRKVAESKQEVKRIRHKS